MLQMLYDKWWKEYDGAGVCDTGDDKVRKDANALTIANVGGVFVVLIVGLMLSPLVAAVEFVWNARRRRRRSSAERALNGQRRPVRHVVVISRLVSPLLCLISYINHRYSFPLISSALLLCMTHLVGLV